MTLRPIIVVGACAAMVPTAMAQTVRDELAQPLPGIVLAAAEMTRDSAGCRARAHHRGFQSETTERCIIGDVSVSGFNFTGTESDIELDESSRRLLAGGITPIGGGVFVGLAASYDILEAEISSLVEYDGGERWGVAGVLGGAAFGIEVTATAGYLEASSDSRSVFVEGGTNRFLNVGLDATASVFSAEIAYPFEAFDSGFRPAFRVETIAVELDSFEETGDASPIRRSPGGDGQVTTLTVGGEASRRYPMADGWALSPYLGLNAVIPVGDDIEIPHFDGSTTDGDPVITNAYAPLGEGHAQLTLGAAIEVNERVSVDVGYRGRFGGDLTDSRLAVGTRFRF